MAPTKRKASSSVISKTKAMAMTRKRTVASVTKSTGGTPDQILLGKLMEHHVAQDGGVSFVDIMKELGMNDHNTKWREVWKDLERSGNTQASDGTNGGFFTCAFHLTSAGIDSASTDEYKALLNQKLPTTNEELHEHIKGKLMNKRGDEIFDLLLHQGPLGRLELAKALGISDRGAYFSYALQQLKELGYVENHPDDQGKRKGKRLRLSDKAFVTSTRGE